MTDTDSRTGTPLWLDPDAPDVKRYQELTQKLFAEASRYISTTRCMHILISPARPDKPESYRVELSIGGRALFRTNDPLEMIKWVYKYDGCAAVRGLVQFPTLVQPYAYVELFHKSQDENEPGKRETRETRETRERRDKRTLEEALEYMFKYYAPDAQYGIPPEIIYQQLQCPWEQESIQPAVDVLIQEFLDSGYLEYVSGRRIALKWTDNPWNIDV